MRRYKDAAPLSPHEVHLGIATVVRRWQRLLKNGAKKRFIKKVETVPTGIERKRLGETKAQGSDDIQSTHNVLPCWCHLCETLTLNAFECICGNLVYLRESGQPPESGSAVTLLCSNFTSFACCDCTRVLGTFLQSFYASQWGTQMSSGGDIQRFGLRNDDGPLREQGRKQQRGLDSLCVSFGHSDKLTDGFGTREENLKQVREDMHAVGNTLS